MPRTGRPPKPLEQKRRTGRTPGTDSGGRPLPKLAEVSVLPATGIVPQYPPELGDHGRDLWDKAWSSAVSWLSPDSDLESVKQAAIVSDQFYSAVNQYQSSMDPKDGMLLVSLSKELTACLSALGFNPTARARLGVAEVRRVSALEDLVAKRSHGQ